MRPVAFGGLYSGPMVTLTASDATSGVALVEYNLDGNGWQIYTNPFQVTADGNHTLQFRATDTAGNQKTDSVSFNVDGTAPVTTASAPCSSPGSNGWCLVPVQVTLSASDSNGIGHTDYSIDGGAFQTYSAPFTISADGSHNVQYMSTDTAGNTEATHTITVKVDQNDPVTTATLTPGIHNGWYASPSLTLTGDDGSGSGIATIQYTLDGGAWQTYSGPLSGFTTGNHFVQYKSTDNAGRVEGVKLIAFKADAVKPTVTISRPADGTVYLLGKVVTSSFKCTDNQSGMDTCVGTQLPGGTNPLVSGTTNLDTSTVGPHTVTVTGTDKAGNVRVVTNHYTVVYTWNGFFSPISNSADSKLNLVHAGDLIKIGFGLNGDRGLSIFAAGSPSSTVVSCPAWAPHTVPAAGAGSVAGLQYGVSSGHYTYGWQTQAGWAGTCRTFDLTLNDGTAAHSAVFMFFA